jgi:uncharacterized protein (UPF0548 family)
VILGSGADVWLSASAAVLTWAVKTRSGFTIQPETPTSPPHVVAGQKYWLTAHIGPLRIREPAFVVEVVNRADRCGFAYGTLEGHPVSGEEAFVVHRDENGVVRLTLRSIVRPPTGIWRPLFPVALIAQHRYRARYRRALQGVG